MKTVTIQVSGPDALNFLQGFVTCDVAALTAEPLFAACCNQKGRIIANFWIWREADNFYFQLLESMRVSLMAHLKQYRFRSKVSFDLVAKAIHKKPGFEPIWIRPETTEQFTPQMINLEKHGGVSFKKGCYLGQEIIARTEHLGKLKRHLYPISISDNCFPNVGDELMNQQQQKMGMIVEITNTAIFAVIEDRAIDDRLFWQTQVVTVEKKDGDI